MGINKRAVEASRAVWPHSELFEMCLYFKEKAEERYRADIHLKTREMSVTMLLCSFTLEAFLNFIGRNCVRYWDHLEKGLRQKQKLLIIAESLQIDIKIGERPFQTQHDMNNYRNKMAHAKPELLEGNFIMEADDVRPRLYSKWEEMINIENVRRFVQDTDEMCAALLKSYDKKKYPNRAPRKGLWYLAGAEFWMSQNIDEESVDEAAD